MTRILLTSRRWTATWPRFCGAQTSMSSPVKMASFGRILGRSSGGMVRRAPVGNAGFCGCGREVRSFTTSASRQVDHLTSSLDGAAAGTPGSPVNVVELIEAVQETGRVAVLFSDSPPVLWTVECLSAMKDVPGMTWISVIMLGTLMIRGLVGFPISVVQQKSIARLESLKPEFQKLGEDLKMETAMAIKKFKWDEKAAQTQFKKSYKKHWRKIVEDNGCHPMRNMALTFLQLPFWICFSSALRNVVYAVPLPRTPDKTDRWLQIHSEGLPWVDSLVLPDPVVLPVIFLTVNLLNIQLNKRQRLQTVPETRMQKIVPWVLRGGIVLIACFATSVPSAVSMYWATSSSLALLQNVLLSTPKAKEFFKLPHTTAVSDRNTAAVTSSGKT